jgi:hypothetical protein
MGGDVIVPVVIALCVAGAVVLRGPLGRARADRLARRAAPADPGAAELSSQLAVELESVKQRLAELEERQDFTERMLTRARAGGGLGPAGGTRAT